MLRERQEDREHEWGRGREGRRERIPGRLRTVSTEPNSGLALANRDVVT